MAKNIVICSDGTGNSAMTGRGTNVFKLFEAVDCCGHMSDPGLAEQVVFYDDGVGTERLKPLRLLAGACGLGLSRNVKQLYAALARTFDIGDRIFLFGFSRGAFTVRTLAGFIATCGILDRKKFENDDELWNGVKAAYNEYRGKFRTDLGKWFRAPYDNKKADEFRRKHAVRHVHFAVNGKVPISFIGVWDTVAAVGLPFDHLTDFINKYIYRFTFPDLKLSPTVKKACHALSLDDERHTFHPVMWDEENEKDDRIEQVWFPGVHSNVGGGYPKQGLSLVALDWMMTKAETAGLRFIEKDRRFVSDHQNVNDKLYDSRTGLAFYYRYKPRDIEKFCNKYNAAPPRVHIGAIERIALGITAYAPGNIPGCLRVVTTNARPRLHLELCGKTIHQALNGNGSLLERAKVWVNIKRYSHYAFAALSSGAIAFVLIYSSQIGWWETLKIGIVLPVQIVLFYLVGWWAGKKKDQVFSAFWQAQASELRKVVAKADD